MKNPGFGLALAVVALLLASRAEAQTDSIPAYRRDRGPGLATSMFGTYVRRGELLIYPFFEYYRDNDTEYKPEDLGYTGPGSAQDFRGRFRASEGLLFFSYGLSDWLAFEIEGSVITATLFTAPDDSSGAPPRIEESGLGDVEGQLRARWVTENEHRPEVFSYFEAVVPHHAERVLIGTAGWELKLGSGIARGFSWGTITLRGSLEYSEEESKLDLGEYAIEYLRRLSPAWRVYLGVEGVQDEVELIGEIQWRIGPGAYVKINNAVALTSKATGWAPELGVMFSVPVRAR